MFQIHGRTYLPTHYVARVTIKLSTHRTRQPSHNGPGELVSGGVISDMIEIKIEK